MAYLLFVNPEMLITGARPSLFRDEYERLKTMPLDDGEPTTEKTTLLEEDLAKKIIKKLKGGTQDEEGAAYDAWALSKELMGLYKYNSYKMWEVEMLCFSASRCRGYLHAKSLGKGGEYLSYIWLLLWRMEMETLADKMQRAPELPEQEDDSAGGGGAEFTNTTSTTPVEAIISDENEKEELQVEEETNDGAACTTPATTVIGDEKRDDDGSSHYVTSAAPATTVIGDENV
ncbi:hypothetical protein HU200_054131 [Digitaria exilis]|uniref:Uncharacterized protein n=1 Tax=Digitaria exilis TaxID=1010633 RepID=A0A835E2T1_9POAL|nr:hypothetical protein HU200_054131 [Digitaria exilis]